MLISRPSPAERGPCGRVRFGQINSFAGQSSGRAPVSALTRMGGFRLIAPGSEMSVLR